MRRPVDDCHTSLGPERRRYCARLAIAGEGSGGGNGKRTSGGHGRERCVALRKVAGLIREP